MPSRRLRVRRLAFEGKEGTERWDVLYGAMLVNPEGYAREARRVARKVLEKLEHLGKPVEDLNMLAKFQFDEESGPRELQLEEAEFVLLRDTVDKIPWTRHAVVLADKTIEWLDATKPS
jgi:hypothetical protein